MDIDFSITRKVKHDDIMDQELIDIFKMYAQKILNSNTSLVKKGLFLKYLIYKLRRTRQAMIEKSNETKRKKPGSGYMHWRTG